MNKDSEKKERGERGRRKRVMNKVGGAERQKRVVRDREIDKKR